MIYPVKSFKKVAIKAGEEITVKIPLLISGLAIVDANENYIMELCVIFNSW